MDRPRSSLCFLPIWLVVQVTSWLQEHFIDSCWPNACLHSFTNDGQLICRDCGICGHGSSQRTSSRAIACNPISWEVERGTVSVSYHIRWEGLCHAWYHAKYGEVCMRLHEACALKCINIETKSHVCREEQYRDRLQIIVPWARWLSTEEFRTLNSVSYLCCYFWDSAPTPQLSLPTLVLQLWLDYREPSVDNNS